MLNVRTLLIFTPTPCIPIILNSSGPEHYRKLHEHRLPLPHPRVGLVIRSPPWVRERDDDALQDGPLLAPGVLLRRLRGRPQRLHYALFLLDHPERVSGPPRPVLVVVP